MTERDQMSDDEMLSAWLDGELSPDDATRLERRLGAEPALARRLERMRTADETVRQAFHAVDAAPLPQGVLDLLEDDDSRPVRGTPGAEVVRLPARGAPRFFQVPVAIAASVALVAGFLIHDLIAPDVAREDGALPVSGVIAQGSGLHRMLETAASAEPVVLADGGSARVVLTFRAEDGEWCRQFRRETAPGSMHGLACRRAGGWRLQTAAFAAPGAPDGTFQQAAGTTPEALEAAVRARLGTGAPLGAEAEKQIISNGWKEVR